MMGYEPLFCLIISHVKIIQAFTGFYPKMLNSITQVLRISEETGIFMLIEYCQRSKLIKV